MRLLVCLGYMLGCTISPVHAASHKFTVLSEIVLHRGLNHVEGFAADGRAADILKAWRDNGNAHGYNLFVVTLPDDRFNSAWNIVGTQQGSEPLLDTVRDDPHTVEDVVRSVRFAHGRIDGRVATLMLVATREGSVGDGLPAPAPVTYQVFELARVADCCGTPDVFRLVATEHSDRPYCNADRAVSQRFGIAPPAEYQGSDKPDGC